MTREELEAELAKIRENLAKVDPGSSIYRVGKLFEAAVLRSIKELG